MQAISVPVRMPVRNGLPQAQKSTAVLAPEYHWRFLPQWAKDDISLPANLFGSIRMFRGMAPGMPESPVRIFGVESLLPISWYWHNICTATFRRIDFQFVQSDC